MMFQWCLTDSSIGFIMLAWNQYSSWIKPSFVMRSTPDHELYNLSWSWVNLLKISSCKGLDDIVCLTKKSSIVQWTLHAYDHWNAVRQASPDRLSPYFLRDVGFYAILLWHVSITQYHISVIILPSNLSYLIDNIAELCIKRGGEGFEVWKFKNWFWDNGDPRGTLCGSAFLLGFKTHTLMGRHGGHAYDSR